MSDNTTDRRAEALSAEGEEWAVQQIDRVRRFAGLPDTADITDDLRLLADKLANTDDEFFDAIVHRDDNPEKLTRELKRMAHQYRGKFDRQQATQPYDTDSGVSNREMARMSDQAFDDLKADAAAASARRGIK